ncbi:AraC family transcriptional regulator [Reichenbachiella versicolor]|uniref:AraC family transcriptional regulator n=1 Tax=Reichenbachiella versicolor TaxID=1821036 RepID=UPI000D6E7E41|nr:AraC family transcriptional regulator [Reichenbachiella versicolor]
MKPQHEHINYEIDSSIHVFKYVNKNFESPWHYHEEFELTFVIKSSGIRYVGNSIDDFYVGDLVLLGPSVPHSWKNNGGYTDGAESICVQWKQEVLNQFLSNSIEFHAIHQMLQKAKLGLRFNLTSCDVESTLLSLLDLEPAPRLLTFLNLLWKLTQLEHITISAIGDFVLDEATDQRVHRVLRHIDDNYNHKITLGEVSDLTFMTEVSFCKFFKRRFNKSFTNYLNEFRIRKVCQLLRESDHKLIEIAMSCGYDNMSFFHRQFKKYMDMTPKEYRSRY